MNLKRLFQGNFAAAALALPAVAGATVLNVDINGRQTIPRRTLLASLIREPARRVVHLLA